MFDNFPSSAQPAFFIFIVDQSERMNEYFYSGLTKADHVVNQLNQIINDLIYLNNVGHTVKDKLFITLLGHSNGKSYDIRSEYLSAFADNPIRIEQLKKKVSDGAGGLIEIDEEVPIFIEALSVSKENQLSAFQLSNELVELMVSKQSKNDYMSIAIFNISGGLTQDWKKTTTLVNKIKTLKHRESKVTICNVLIDQTIKSLTFPSIEEVFNQNLTTQIFFEWSTYIPERFVSTANLLGYNSGKVDTSCKYFFNQNFKEIVNLFESGS